MSFDVKEFGKFKIIQDDGNWVDHKRFQSVVNYWARYFNTMIVKGAIIHKEGEQPNPTYDLSHKLIALKGHTSINLLAIVFASARCGHTLYFDNATNLTKAWYSKVKPNVLMVGDDDMSLPGSRYVSGPNCTRLLFTRRFTTELPEYVAPNKEVKDSHILIHHKDKKARKFSVADLKKTMGKFEKPPAVAYIELDTKHQINQLVDTVIPLMFAGAKIVPHTGITGHNHKQWLTEHRPDVVYWGEDIIKLIKDKDPVLDTLIPAPIFVPHIRKEKVVKEKPGFLKDPV